MKLATLVVTALALLAGCGKRRCYDCGGPMLRPAETTCASDYPATCQAGFVDGCTKQLTTRHVCVAADAVAGPACEQQIQLTCPDGFYDACGGGGAATHICVAY